MSQPPSEYPGQQPYGGPYPPQSGTPYAQPGTVYGQPQSGVPYGQPQSGAPYGQQPGTVYGQPQSGSPYGQPQSGSPYGQTYGTPAADAYQQGYGANVQPYQQPLNPATYGQQLGQAQLVSAGGRLGAVLLDGLLMIVTLWIGWIIWSLIVWSDGQSPGKKILGYVVVDANTGQRFDWGRMALREFCIKGLLGGFLGPITFGIYTLVDCFMVFGDRQRTLHDRIANSVVVREG